MAPSRGKDPTKVDRSAAYAARWVAKNVVAAGLADRFEVEVAYGIGIAQPISFSVESFGTGRIADDAIQALIERHFDLRPASIIAALDLRRPIYRQTAAYGHFGRPDLDLPWERTDKAALLAAEAGLPEPEPVASASAPADPRPAGQGAANAATPASTASWSCAASPPLTPTAPTSTPSRSSGMPPAKTIIRPAATESYP